MTYKPNNGTMAIPVMLSQDSTEENIGSQITAVIPKPNCTILDPASDSVKTTKNPDSGSVKTTKKRRKSTKKTQ